MSFTTNLNGMGRGLATAYKVVRHPLLTAKAIEYRHEGVSFAD